MMRAAGLFVSMLLVLGCGSESAGDRAGSGGAGGSAGKPPLASGGSSGTSSSGTGGKSSGGGGTPSSGGSAGEAGDSGGAPDPFSPCPALAIDHDQSVGGYLSDAFHWHDASCSVRTAAMVHNDVKDPSGHWGGYLRRYEYALADSTRVCTGSSSSHPGFGYTVTHFGTTSSSSRNTAGKFERVFEGKNHAILRYTWDLPIDGHTVHTTVQWFFANGRTHPVWAITYDLTQVAANAVKADTRAPYGDMGWDGDAQGDVEGVGWGDRYRFRSLGNGPVTQGTGWDYSKPNTIPHVIEWSAAADAEMGVVQTQTMDQHDAGGYWLYSSWGTSKASGPMPQDYNWTYQLNQYELPFTTHSHRLAWGANFGAVGNTAYNAYGDDKQLSGYPYQSYAVFVVLGTHTAALVEKQIEQIENVQNAKWNTSVGSVTTSGPAGIARTDSAIYQPAGYNPIFSAWELAAENGKIAANLELTAGALDSPVLLVHGYLASEPPASIHVGDSVLNEGQGFFASVDPSTQTLWLTLRASLSGTTAISIP